MPAWMTHIGGTIPSFAVALLAYLGLSPLLSFASREGAQAVEVS